MEASLPWLAIASSVLVVCGYELRELLLARRDPAATARSAHRVLRGEWVRALSKQPGSEILAVQALRNSLMSATINGSTAVLVLMGAISLMISKEAPTGIGTEPPSVRVVLELALVLALFATYVCAAMAMRYYHHSGFVLSLPVGSPERSAREPVAMAYVQRAGTLYSWSLRCFLFALPIGVGLMNPLFMPVAALLLVAVLSLFDRGPKPLVP